MIINLAFILANRKITFKDKLKIYLNFFNILLYEFINIKNYNNKLIIIINILISFSIN